MKNLTLLLNVDERASCEFLIFVVGQRMDILAESRIATSRSATS